MRRRPFLAVAGSLSASLVGCAGRRSTPTATRTPTPDTTTRPSTPLTETLDPPDPPASPTVADAEAYVRENERVAVHNDLVRYGGGDPALSPRLSEPRAAAVVDAAEGVYLFGACEGRAEYTERGGYGTNHHAVPYFVGDGVARRAPWTAVVCRLRDSPYAASDPDENAVPPGEAPGAELHVYQFADDPAPLTVSLDYLGDDGDATYVERRRLVHDRDVADDPGPPVPFALSNLAVREGTYRVTAAVEGGSTTRTRWTLGPDTDAPAWTSTSVLVGPAGTPHVAVPDVHEALRPSRSRCLRAVRDD
jgi:hypothetical protein